MAPNLEQYLTNPEIEAAKTASSSASQTAADYQSASATLPFKLREAINQKLDYNKDIITEQNLKKAEYFAAPSELREKYQGIWNPFEREKLVAQGRTQAGAAWQTLNDILAQRMGTISDVVQAGTAGFQAATSAAQSKADRARQQYLDLVGQADKLIGLKQWEYEQATKGGSGRADPYADDAAIIRSWQHRYDLATTQEERTSIMNELITLEGGRFFDAVMSGVASPTEISQGEQGPTRNLSQEYKESGGVRGTVGRFAERQAQRPLYEQYIDPMGTYGKIANFLKPYILGEEKK